MAKFNIVNSKVGQLNESGDNIQVTGNSAPVSIGDGPVAQTSGDKANATANQPKKSSVWKQLCVWAVSIWKLVTGKSA